jgi:glycolate oxidase
VTPAVVVLPRSTAEVAATVRACHDAGIPFVARGSGTGLSAARCRTPTACSSCCRRCAPSATSTRPTSERCLDPGVINLQVSKAAAPHGYYYAPGPVSQQICSIGGNVAENSGGAHCLKYGFTTNHVTGLELVTPTGTSCGSAAGPRTRPATTCSAPSSGSEGTLGVDHRGDGPADPRPRAVRTLLAAFLVDREAGGPCRRSSVPAFVPAAIEMMDALAIEAAEAAVHCGYPDGAGRGADRGAGRAAGP